MWLSRGIFQDFAIGARIFSLAAEFAYDRPEIIEESWQQCWACASEAEEIDRPQTHTGSLFRDFSVTRREKCSVRGMILERAL